MQSQLQEAVNAIKSGNTDRAKQLLADVLKHNPQDENAWLWMTKCVTSNDEKRYCFERVLKINPQNQHAIEGIRRLNNPVPPTPLPRATQQQSVSPPQRKKSNSWLFILMTLGFVGFICFCCGFYLLGSPVSSPTKTVSNVPTKKTRPDYKRILEANGFVYRMNAENGDPIYVSPCGCVVTVNPDYVGFAAKYYPDNQCPIEDMGAIIRIMYPPEVIDFIVSNMNAVISEDTTVHGTAAGYRINIDFDPYDPKLIITIEDHP